MKAHASLCYKKPTYLQKKYLNLYSHVINLNKLQEIEILEESILLPDEDLKCKLHTVHGAYIKKTFEYKGKSFPEITIILDHISRIWRRMIKKLKDDSGHISAVYVTTIEYRVLEFKSFSLHISAEFEETTKMFSILTSKIEFWP